MESFDKAAFLQHLTAEEQEEVRKSAKKVALAPGEMFVREGEISHVIYMTAQERANVIVSGSRQVSYVVTFERGQIVGELSALTNRAHVSNMAAREAVHFISLDLQTLSPNLHAKVLHFLVDDLSNKVLSSKQVDLEASPPPTSILVLFGWK